MKIKRKRGIWYGDLTPLSPRMKTFPREAAAYVILKRNGQSINNIKNLVGRSTSFVARILSTYANSNKIRFGDLRKLPRLCRLRHAVRMRFLMMKLSSQWIAFILGEGDQPP